MTPTRNPNRRPSRRPRVLVLEALTGAATCVRDAGATAIVANPRELRTVDVIAAGEYDALLLTGGGDVNPSLYGERPHRRVYGVHDTRDLVETTALAFAEQEGIPVLGICRGMQLMAVHNGGRLKQHIDGHRNRSHLVFAESGSKLRRTFQHDVGYFVSLHHQSVVRHGSGFRVAARCKDGRIEAIESKDGRCLGVQWHPEMDATRNPQSRSIFRWLVLEAASRAGLARPSVPKRRPARRVSATPKPGSAQMTLSQAPGPRSRKSRVATSWFCRDCGLQFDSEQDRDDHEYWICGTPTLRTMEPPPGHHDWLPIVKGDDAA